MSLTSGRYLCSLLVVRSNALLVAREGFGLIFALASVRWAPALLQLLLVVRQVGVDLVPGRLHGVREPQVFSGIESCD